MSDEISAEDQARLEHEAGVMAYEAFVRSVPGGRVMRGPRIFFCGMCDKPVAIAIRPDTEVVTEEQRHAMSVMAQGRGVPLINAEDDPPECPTCGGDEKE
jgi:hypothetical protein